MFDKFDGFLKNVSNVFDSKVDYIFNPIQDHFFNYYKRRK